MNASHDFAGPVSSADHVRGSHDAAVTIIEYGDFECPSCNSDDAVEVGNDSSRMAGIVSEWYALNPAIRRDVPGGKGVFKSSSGAECILTGLTKTPRLCHARKALSKRASVWRALPGATPVTKYIVVRASLAFQPGVQHTATSNIADEV
jgi:Thioredoxin